MSVPAIDFEKFTPAERLELLDQLWDSLDEAPETVPLTDEQRQELDHRLDTDDDSEGIPWDEVVRQVRGRKR